MKPLLDTINRLQAEITTVLEKATTLQELEHIRIKYLGRAGAVAQCMDMLKELTVDEKRLMGPRLNSLKQEVEKLFSERFTTLTEEDRKRDILNNRLDVTASRPSHFAGGLHLYTHLAMHIEGVFTSMGYTLADGPEIEHEFYNFDALNIPASHPARDMFDTIWIDNAPGMLLRTHTSPIQIHAMLARKALPLAIFAPGRTYRLDATDATHDFVFSQVEGLFVDKNVSMGNLIATAKTFLAALFGKTTVEIRVRPSYFPFVEPGIEIDLNCPFCTEGCHVCKKSRWIELMGAGLVHPNVLRAGGIDADVYSGFAFGIGLERLAMVTYGINDIRLFHSNKMPFLEQFR